MLFVKLEVPKSEWIHPIASCSMQYISLLPLVAKNVISVALIWGKHEVYIGKNDIVCRLSICQSIIQNTTVRFWVATIVNGLRCILFCACQRQRLCVRGCFFSIISVDFKLQSSDYQFWDFGRSPFSKMDYCALGRILELWKRDLWQW